MPTKAAMAGEPFRDPIWPDAPRYGADTPWPPYAFRPGHDPHPVDHPEGHSLGLRHEPTVHPPEAWRANADYLRAVDLYHRGYFWEAHELWEGLWRAEAAGTPARSLYKGLIHLAAAELKRAVRNERGFATHVRRAHASLSAAPARYMGLDVAALRRDAAALMADPRRPAVRLALGDEPAAPG